MQSFSYFYNFKARWIVSQLIDNICLILLVNLCYVSFVYQEDILIVPCYKRQDLLFNMGYYRLLVGMRGVIECVLGDPMATIKDSVDNIIIIISLVDFNSDYPILQFKTINLATAYSLLMIVKLPQEEVILDVKLV